MENYLYIYLLVNKIVFKGKFSIGADSQNIEYMSPLATFVDPPLYGILIFMRI